MTIRQRFERQLDELRDRVIEMGDQVERQLEMALEALAGLDTDLAAQVFEADNAVNQARFAIEEECFALIVTQQPAARDLRAVVAVMNMIVDLERMGDQCKGIARVIPHMIAYPNRPRPEEIQLMGRAVGKMLHQSMVAYGTHNADLARLVAAQDDEVDALYASVFSQIMEHMARTKKPGKVEASYEALRAARELERFGDLATNLAERVIYIVTGEFYEVNVDRDHSVQ